MTDQQQESLREAREIVRKHVQMYPSKVALENAIASAIAAARQVLPGMVRYEGADRKVPDEGLPITADGAVVLMGVSIVWHPEHPYGGDVEWDSDNGWRGVFSEAKPHAVTNYYHRIDECYWSSEAAQAAQRSKSE